MSIPSTAKEWNRVKPSKQPSLTAQEQLLLRSVAPTSPFRSPGHTPPEPPSGPRAACSVCGALFITVGDTTADTFLHRHRMQHAPADPVDPAEGYWADGRIKQWYCLYRALKRDLGDGRWGPGEVLPILQLCEEHGVAQPVLGRVLSRLADEQLVYFSGSGTRRRTVVWEQRMVKAERRVAEVAEQLRVRIEAGEWPPGMSLPKATLCRELGTSMVTLARALVILENKGVIRQELTGMTTTPTMGIARMRAIVVDP